MVPLWIGASAGIFGIWLENIQKAVRNVRFLMLFLTTLYVKITEMIS